MKYGIILILTIAPFYLLGQDHFGKGETEIREVINLFFKSIEDKDSILMKQTTLDEAQIWRRNSDANPIKQDMRFSRDDLPRMATMPDLRELALDFEIKVHNGIAVAWVPYEFYVEDQFSHCGIDIFTLFQIDGIWKIVSAAYSIENKSCEELRSKAE